MTLRREGGRPLLHLSRRHAVPALQSACVSTRTIGLFAPLFPNEPDVDRDFLGGAGMLGDRG